VICTAKLISGKLQVVTPRSKNEPSTLNQNMIMALDQEYGVSSVSSTSITTNSKYHSAFDYAKFKEPKLWRYVSKDVEGPHKTYPASSSSRESLTDYVDTTLAHSMP
jgi:hypothetical protein